jgi:hypothetical protein
MSIATPTSNNISIVLRADGKNWKDWDKQLRNCATAIGATAVLTKGTVPHYDETSALYKQLNLVPPNLSDPTMTPAQITIELHRVEEINKYMRPVNKDRKERHDEDYKAREDWLVRDARLQNIILCSVDKALTSQLRLCTSACDMHTVLNELNHSSDHANAGSAWASFVDLRADNCTSIRQYLGKFREAIADVTVAGINISWKKPSQVKDAGTAINSVEELMVIHMLHGLAKVIPQWVEDRSNDLRKGQSWTIDALIASVEDHIRHTNEEPVKTFATVAKQQEETRVLNRLKQQKQQQAPTTVTTPNSQQPSSRGPRAPKMRCPHCEKEHAGGVASCWKLHPELIPEAMKATWNKPRTNTANVTIANTGTAGLSYGNYVYATISTTVSPTLLSKAVNNNEYKQRYCYDTAANRHVFNDRSKFVEYLPITLSDVHGSTGSTVAQGVGVVRLHVVKSDGTTHNIHLTQVLYCPEFATNVISQAPFKRKGVWYHSGKDKLYTAEEDEIAYLPEIDGIPNFLVVTDPSQAPAALSYSSLVAYRSSSKEPSTSRPATEWHHIYGHANIETLKRTAKAVKGMELTTSILTNCRPCGLAKSKHSISRLQQTTPSRILDKVHVDILDALH